MRIGVATSLAIVGSVLVTPALAADLTRYYPPASAKAAPALYSPAPLITGNVELFFGTADPTAGGAGTVVGGGGMLNMPLNAEWNLQVDAFAESISTSPSLSTGGVAAHFYKRDPNAYALGFFVGAANAHFGGGSSSGPLIGAEGQIYNGPLTLGGDVSVASLSGGVGTVFQVHGQARYYLTPNFKLQADLALASASNGPDGTAVAGTAEYRFSNTPFSAFGSVRFDSASSNHVTTGLIGGRLFFDPPGATLQSHERSGAGWQTFQTLF